MPKIAYRSQKFSAARQSLINTANKIIAEYAEQGFELTLRQLYYQFVSRDLIPNTQRDYKNLGEVISDARMAGLIDWEAIVDRTRFLRKGSCWDGPEEIIASCARQFRLDLWESQPNYVEVWIEKDALVGVIEPVCDELRLPYFSCRGYTSQSEMWAAARRLRSRTNDGKEVTILHFGDHDPSGKDMSRDIHDRIQEFTANDPLITLRRMALTMDQVEQYGPPPNPAKITDSRAAGYIKEFGSESWELDALEPRVIAELIRNEVGALRHDSLWELAIDRENKFRKELELARNHWDAVRELINKLDK